ncbi:MULTISPECIES: PTS sugar transporter subunit IIA [unclassified Brenneria]|uniref:PTS sugar transporter subunit IIA n=1 Tax=unclassified Brenneria TaxID=2634434 RepID=UPI001553ACB2|nr:MULTISPECIES: PTS sugar transporter subunit IIA [unclassified Brenneria]MBJ7221373.1 PTS sugar transporter subunit IIA [Brenneria sp. L3-3C-1]MEE3642617.1 PTS sugar transporter subunit IIA [Brenneria sp. L3_3C_1]MEE3650011.1 PTS sugar transporter subunit IIA [Brenneria sp. HEZEL_4_2_4]NPC99969.1 PTS sugar transporter subunit IIA [Brenneria sp. hezel4-2-4]
MLKDLLTPDVIQLIDRVEDWRSAVAVSCQPLIDNHAIEPRYLEAIYRSHQAIGPYYVIGPGIAMPHARPEEGVNRQALSLTVIRNGVDFAAGENDPVRLLVVLAAADSHSHIDTISQLAALFDNSADTAAIMQANSPQEILAIVARY